MIGIRFIIWRVRLMIKNNKTRGMVNSLLRRANIIFFDISN